MIEGKGRIAAQTTARVFRLLNLCGLPTHYFNGGEDDDKNEMLVRRAQMIPIEVVVRGVAAGSLVRRRPGIARGSLLVPRMIEFFLKDDANHDPQIEPDAIVAGGIANAQEIATMSELARIAYEILAHAWRRRDALLVDLKLEFGRLASGEGKGELVIADVIDNDSWRVWPQGREDLMLDKQLYRNLETVTPGDLERVRGNYETVADVVGTFPQMLPGMVALLADGPENVAAADDVGRALGAFGLPVLRHVVSVARTPGYVLQLVAQLEATFARLVLVPIGAANGGAGGDGRQRDRQPGGRGRRRRPARRQDRDPLRQGVRAGGHGRVRAGAAHAGQRPQRDPARRRAAQRAAAAAGSGNRACLSGFACREPSRSSLRCGPPVTTDVGARPIALGAAAGGRAVGRRAAAHRRAPRARPDRDGSVRVRRAVERALLLQVLARAPGKAADAGTDGAARGRRGRRDRAPRRVRGRDLRDRRRARVAQPPLAGRAVRGRGDRHRRDRARRAVHGRRGDRRGRPAALRAAGEPALPLRRAERGRRHRRLRQRNRRAQRRRRRVRRRVVRRQRAGQRRRARGGEGEGRSSTRRAPRGSAGWDIVLVGKATDRSGFGGASFSSVTLDEEDAEQNKGAVQVPDPFLKNVVMRASYAVFAELRARGIEVGFKDLARAAWPAAARSCARRAAWAPRSSSTWSDRPADLPPEVIAIGETQERLCWIVPPSFTPVLLAIYNDVYTLPRVARGAVRGGDRQGHRSGALRRAPSRRDGDGRRSRLPDRRRALSPAPTCCRT